LEVIFQPKAASNRLFFSATGKPLHRYGFLTKLMHLCDNAW